MMSINKNDYEYLLAIGDYRILTAGQLAMLTGRKSGPALRRRLRQLSKEGLLQIITRSLDHTPGHPENLYALTERGVDLIRDEGLVPKRIKYAHATLSNLHLLEHEYMINMVRLHLVQLQWLMPELSVRFFGNRSSLLGAGDGDYLGMQECLKTPSDEGSECEFIPDAALAVTHREVEKTILLFLEADTGTQPLTSTTEGRRDIRHKIANYRSYLTRQSYKAYEATLSAELRGFRLLFLTASPNRLAGLCRLIREHENADFMWTAHRQDLEQKGLWAPIWVRGGQDTAARESILGTKMPQPCPTPASIVCPRQDSGGVWSTVRGWLGLT